jgi:hypothetical protein
LTSSERQLHHPLAVEDRFLPRWLLRFGGTLFEQSAAIAM